MKLQQNQPTARYNLPIDTDTCPNIYPAAKFLLQEYITLWTKHEAAGNTFRVSQAHMNLLPGGEATYQCMVRLVEAGLLAGISSAGVSPAGLEIRFSFEAISLLVERSFDFPNEKPQRTAEAILAHFLLPGNKPYNPLA